MRLTVRDGRKPHPDAVSAMQRGVRAVGDPDVEVVLSDDFDGAVRAYTESTTYSSDRGTGTVGAKTLKTPRRTIIVNGLVTGDAEPATIERLLAHESSHVLMNERDEGVGGRQNLADTEWQWYLLCMAGHSMEEVRAEHAAFAAGYASTDSSSGEHIVEVLHATNVDLLNLVHHPASADPEHLKDGVMDLLDRLSKVLAYLAAHTLHAGTPPDIAGEGPLATAAWNDLVASTWGQRLAIYAALPPATEPIPEAAWHTALRAAAELEHAQLQALGFTFEERVDGTYFLSRLTDAKIAARYARARAQERAFRR